MWDSKEGHHNTPITVRALFVLDCCKQGVKEGFSYHLSKFPLGGWLTTIQSAQLVLVSAPRVFINWRYVHLIVPYNQWFNLPALGVSHKAPIDFIRHRARVLLLLHLIKSEFTIFGNSCWAHLLFTRLSKPIKAEHRASQGYGFYWYFQENAQTDKAELEEYFDFVKLLFSHCDLYNCILHILHCYKR